jgi:hypothetical protein
MIVRSIDSLGIIDIGEGTAISAWADNSDIGWSMIPLEQVTVDPPSAAVQNTMAAGNIVPIPWAPRC